MAVKESVGHQAAGQEIPLTMVVSGGVFALGKMQGGNKLLKPRLFRIIEKEKRDSQGRVILDEMGNKIMENLVHMSPFPGTPPFVVIDPGGIHYTIPFREDNRNIYNLYKQVTDPSVDPG